MLQSKDVGEEDNQQAFDEFNPITEPDIIFRTVNVRTKNISFDRLRLDTKFKSSNFFLFLLALAMAGLLQCVQNVVRCVSYYIEVVVVFVLIFFSFYFS